MQTAILVLGWIATSLLFVAFAPQSYKVMKNKSAAGVSKITYPMVFIGSSAWAIYSSLGGFMQPWICNTVIIVMMIPTVYYIFKENKAIMIATLSAGLGITLLALILFILVKTGVMNEVHIEWLSWIFIAVAGTGTGLSYIPQLINIIKTKKIGNVSVLTLTIVSLANIGWILYWLLSYIYHDPNSFSQTIILSTVWSFMGFAFQLPVIYLYIKQRIDMKNTKKSKA